MDNKMQTQGREQQLRQELINGCAERMQWALSMYPEQLRPSPETQANYTVEWLDMAHEVGMDAFSAALVQSVRESDYFPVISKIRQCAGVNQKQQEASGSDAAWLYLQQWLRKWPDGGENVGRNRNAPRLPPRIEHAARLAGGVAAIEWATDKNLPFLKRDFMEAWKNYSQSAAQYNALQLEAPIDLKLLRSPEAQEPVSVKKLAEVCVMPSKLKPTPRELTDAEIEDRRRILRQQALNLNPNIGQELEELKQRKPELFKPIPEPKETA